MASACGDTSLSGWEHDLRKKVLISFPAEDKLFGGRLFCRIKMFLVTL